MDSCTMWNKIYDNFNFHWMFLSSRHITLSQKISYLVGKYIALVTRSPRVNFLGKYFEYDNPFTPVLLEGYPSEIEILDNVINLKTIKTVLDIGANIGQWAFTMKSFYP